MTTGNEEALDAARYQVRQLDGDVAAEDQVEAVEVDVEVEVVEVVVEVEEEMHPPSMVLIAVTSPVNLLKVNFGRWEQMDAGKSISAAGPIIIVIMTLVLEETRTSRMANVPFSS